MNIIITEALPEDAEQILIYTQKIGSETQNMTFGPEGIQMSIPEEKEYLREIHHSKQSIFLLAKIDNQIVATASFNGNRIERMKHRGEIAISVLKSLWGQGIGSMLMEALLDFAQNKAKVEIVSLEVRSDNLSAIHLYEKYGFRKFGTFQGFFKIDGEYIDFDYMNLYFNQ